MLTLIVILALTVLFVTLALAIISEVARPFRPLVVPAPGVCQGVPLAPLGGCQGEDSDTRVFSSPRLRGECHECQEQWEYQRDCEEAYREEVAQDWASWSWDDIPF